MKAQRKTLCDHDGLVLKSYLIGDGNSTKFEVEHNFRNQDFVFSSFDTKTGNFVGFDCKHLNDCVLEVTAAQPLENNRYQINLIGYNS